MQSPKVGLNAHDSDFGLRVEFGYFGNSASHWTGPETVTKAGTEPEPKLT